MRCCGATRRFIGATGKSISRRDKMNPVIGLDISKKKATDKLS
jgi:hypothetical protein